MAALGALVITAPAQASFAPEGSPLAVGAAQPYGVVTADFNRDGRTDAATVNGTGSNLSVFLRGTGGFVAEAGSPFPTGPGPGYGFVADFNADGLPDVATQNFSNGTVSVMIRQPAGGFAAEPALSVGSGTGSVTAADFNADGRVDIAATSLNSSNVVTFLRNAANNGFTAEGPAHPTGAGPRDVVAADFNHDTLPDLATTDLNAGTVSVLIRQPTGDYLSEAPISVGASPEGIEAADFNGDGYPDIAVAVLGTNTVNVLLRNPGGGFTAEAPIPVGAGALGLATADFNADARPDLAVTSNTAGTVTALLRQAGGGFTADGAPLAAPGANGVAAGDFNGDGKPDLAASNDQANTLSVFLNTTAPAAGPAPVTQQPPPAPPVPGKSVVVRVVSGKVLIKYPRGKAPPGGSTTKFAPLTGAVNIPIGSVIDTTKGRIALTSAADTGGKKTQTADFYQGVFQVKQSVPRKKPKKPAALTTDLVMKGQIARSQCAPLKGARSATVDKKKGPKAVLGKLWGNGKGRFRTNGKYSSATVRGTIWLVQDRCDGTLTKVTRGTVRVRDFKAKRTVTVKAGHTYLARAQRAASKSRR
jgi:hypothetical protein